MSAPAVVKLTQASDYPDYRIPVYIVTANVLRFVRSGDGGTYIVQGNGSDDFVPVAEDPETVAALFNGQDTPAQIEAKNRLFKVEAARAARKGTCPACDTEAEIVEDEGVCQHCLAMEEAFAKEAGQK